MPFDAIFMTALAGELRQKLTGGKEQNEGGLTDEKSGIHPQ